MASKTGMPTTRSLLRLMLTWSDSPTGEKRQSIDLLLPNSILCNTCLWMSYPVRKGTSLRSAYNGLLENVGIKIQSSEQRIFIIAREVCSLKFDHQRYCRPHSIHDQVIPWGVLWSCRTFDAQNLQSGIHGQRSRCFRSPSRKLNMGQDNAWPDDWKYCSRKQMVVLLLGENFQHQGKDSPAC